MSLPEFTLLPAGLPAEPRGSKLSGRDGQDGFRRGISVEQRDKAPMDRTRLGPGQLLVQDTLGERGKVASGRPRQVEGARPLDQVGHHPITRVLRTTREGRGERESTA